MDEAREPKDRIEHIVREAEEGANFEFNPAAWAAMEQKLDRVQPVPFSLWKVLFPLAGLSLILAILLWPLSAQDRQRARLTVQPETTEARVEENLKNQPEAAAEGLNAKPQIPNDTASGEVSGEATESNDRLSSQTYSDEGNNTQASARQGNDSPITDDKQSQVNDVLTPKTGVNARSMVPVKRAVLTGAPADTGGAEPGKRLFDVDMLSVYWYPIALNFPEPDLVFEVDSSHFREGKPEPEYFERSKWAVSAMVSLDMSATGLDGFTDPGTMFGLGVEYFFARSWSIQSGAAIAVKKYSALGSEYENNWPAAQNEAFVEALANCLVIDIPLNIRKYFYTKKGKTFFASSGISSYLMLREDYNYEYTENRPNWPTFWRYENQNNHFLGILNLSVGYETPVGKNLGLGIEPFMKLPLTGIGQGRVRFLSFGTNVAIKLRK